MNHIKMAKSCIKIRNNDTDKKDNFQFNCSSCNRNFSSKQKLKNHQDICTDHKMYVERRKMENTINEQVLLLKQKDEHILELKTQIIDLQNRMQILCEKAISKPTTINQNNKLDNSINNTYNHLQPINLSYDHLYQVLDKNLKIEHIYQGQRGLANVVAQSLLKDEHGKPLAFCNDKSRQVIKYKSLQGDIIKDTKAFNLVSSIAPVAEQIAIKRKNEFEKVHFSKEDEKKERVKKRPERPDNYSMLDSSSEEDDDDFFSEEEEIDIQIESLNNEENDEKKKEKIENIIHRIEANPEWDDEKKDFYLRKLVKGITNLQILNVNSNLFSKQLSMILPSENHLSELSTEKFNQLINK